MKLKIAKPMNYDLSERELQTFIEQNLDSIGDWGLQYVASYVPIGTGIIDILAVDDEDHPVIIECKKIGEKFDKDAVFQLMRYYSWFITDPNHVHIIHKMITNKYPDKIDLDEDILLVAIVGDIEDEVKNACWAIDTDIMLVKLSLVQDSNGDLLISPKIILDTSTGVERIMREPKTVSNHFEGKENMNPLYEELIKKMQKELPQIVINPAPQDYIGISNRVLFCCVHVKKQWLRLDLLLSPKEADEDSEFKQYGEYDWGYIHLGSVDELDGKKWDWIKKAYLKVS